MTNESPILFTVEEQIAKIVLNRPEVLNSINSAMAQALQDCLEECKKNTDIRCVYITGAGRAFCAGQDLNEVVGEEMSSISSHLERYYNPIIKRICELEKPVVGAVNGVAAGAGVSLAIACDIAVAAESAGFVQSFNKIGLVPDSGGTFLLPRLIGYQRAAALMMLCEQITATEAERIGMIYKTLSDKSFAEKSWQVAQKLAVMPTKSLGLTKRALNYSQTNDINRQLAIEAELQDLAGRTNDFKEGVQAFLEKRDPKFSGN